MFKEHWRHDRVLRALADKQQHSPKQSITFVRAGEKLLVDLGRQPKFPEHISATSLRPDVVLTHITSESTKQVILVELTVPWEDQMEEANKRMRAKYAKLV